MKILLLDLAAKNNFQEPYEHLGLGYLASALRQNNHQVRIMSSIIENLSFRQVVKRVLAYDPDVLGLSVKSIHAQSLIQLVTVLRSKGFLGHITLGGHFPSFHHEEILRDYPFIDSAIRGEGELAFPELVKGLPEKDLSDIAGLSYRCGDDVVVNEQRKILPDLDKIPFPARDNANQVLKKGGFLSISASRGCYANCTFCSIANFYDANPGKKWRCRSPESLADEILLLIKKYNTNNFKFIDDQLFFSRRKAIEYLESLKMLLDRQNTIIKFVMNCRANHIDYEQFYYLKKMGLQKVFIGVESAHQRGLDTFQKGTTVEMNNKALRILDKLGINYDVGFILIDPYTTYEELYENLKYLSDLRKQMKGKRSFLSVTTSLQVYGGTPIYRKLINESRLEGNYIDGFDYQVKNDYVKLFQFTMDSIVERRLLPIYHSLQYMIRFLNNKKTHLSFAK